MKDVSADPNAPLRFADSRARTGRANRIQSLVPVSLPDHPSQLRLPEVSSRLDRQREHIGICDQHLDTQIAAALAAESDNSPDTTALWAQADRTVTHKAPIVALAIPSNIEFVSARGHNYQWNFQQGPLLDQFWLR